MLRGLIVFIVLAALAAVPAYLWYRQDGALHERLAAQIESLEDQLSRLQKQNDQLKAELAKVQQEQTRLNADNQALRKALEQAKLTGKAPSLPYPPK